MGKLAQEMKKQIFQKGGEDLSAFLPKKMGEEKKHKKGPKSKNQKAMDEDYEVEELADDPMMAMMPMSFGKKDQKRDLTASFEKTKRAVHSSIEFSNLKHGTKEPKVTVTPVQEDDEDESDDMIGPMPAEAEIPEEEDEDEDEEDEFPISHEIELKDHTKAVSAIALDPSGSRLVSGSYDYDIKFWDFAGMNSALKPFKSLEAEAGHPLHHLEYSLTGDSLLVITSSLQPRIFSRDGVQIGEFVRGDMYIRDMRHTKGHVSEVTSGMWHPNDKTQFITGAADSTVRIWDVNNRWEHKTVLIVRGKGGGQHQRTKVTACAYSPDAKWIGAASTDGTINLWGYNTSLTRPTMTVDAHVRQTETSGIVFSQDGNHVVSRGGDDTVKLWDIRKFKAPLAQLNNLENNHAESNLIYSPNQKYILTGESCHPDQQGHLLILDSQTLSTVRKVPIGQSSVIRVHWNSKINQLITGSHDGTIRVLYSPNSSLRGAKLIISRGPKARHVDDDTTFTMGAVEGYSGDQAARLEDGEGERLMRKLKAQNKGNIKATRPEMPSSAVASDPDKDHVRATYGLSTMRNEDPREALLKYAEKAEKDPIFTKAYLKNQPKTLLEERAGEDVIEPPAKRRKDN
jgi:WD repeat-containing protein 70